MGIGMDMDVQIDIGRDIFETKIFVIGQSIALKLVHPITDQT